MRRFKNRRIVHTYETQWNTQKCQVLCTISFSKQKSTQIMACECDHIYSFIWDVLINQCPKLNGS